MGITNASSVCWKYRAVPFQQCREVLARHRVAGGSLQSSSTLLVDASLHAHATFNAITSMSVNTRAEHVARATAARIVHAAVALGCMVEIVFDCDTRHGSKCATFSRAAGSAEASVRASNIALQLRDGKDLCADERARLVAEGRAVAIKAQKLPAVALDLLLGYVRVTTKLGSSAWCLRGSAYTGTHRPRPSVLLAVLSICGSMVSTPSCRPTRIWHGHM